MNVPPPGANPGATTVPATRETQATTPEAPAASSPAKRRSDGPDQLKGVLILLVIMGHAFTASLGEDPVRWMIYGFHMPAFLFLSGYMLSAARLRERGFVDLIRHYWSRMLVAWLAVSLLWRFDKDAQARWDPRTLAEDLLVEPSYHLWYIPALMLAIVIAWALVRLPKPGYWVGAIAIGAYVGTAIYRQVGDGYDFDYRYITSLTFFGFGLMVRNGWAKVLPPRWATASAVLGAAGFLTAYVERDPWRDLGHLLLNLGLLSLIPVFLKMLDRLVPALGPDLALLGRESLWLYLLHPFFTQRFTPDLPAPLSWVAAVVLTLGIAATYLVVIKIARAVRERRAIQHA